MKSELDIVNLMTQQRKTLERISIALTLLKNEAEAQLEAGKDARTDTHRNLLITNAAGILSAVATIEAAIQGEKTV